MEPIKFCVAAPMAHLDLTEDHSSMLFVLSQHYRDNKSYREMCLRMRSKGTFTIMDSGAGDHDFTTTDEQLIEFVKELKPDFVIPRDILFDKDTTIKNLDIFVDLMIEHDLLSTTGIMGCPQGNTKEEWLECYSYMHAHPMVGMIGLSKIAIPRAFCGASDDQDIVKARIECVSLLVRQGMIDKPLHLLGGAELQEFRHYYIFPNFANIISHDSCITVLSGQCLKKMDDPSYERMKTPKDYFETTLTDDQIEVALYNINLLKQELTGSLFVAAVNGHYLCSTIEKEEGIEDLHSFRAVAIPFFSAGLMEGISKTKQFCIVGSQGKELLSYQDNKLFLLERETSLEELEMLLVNAIPPVEFKETIPQEIIEGDAN